MKKVIKLNEKDLTRIVKMVIEENTNQNEDIFSEDLVDFFIKDLHSNPYEYNTEGIREMLEIGLKQYSKLYRETKGEADKYLMKVRKIKSLLKEL